jgi:hypothetical protein
MLIRGAEKWRNSNLAARFNDGSDTSKGLVRKGHPSGPDKTGGGRLRPASAFEKSTRR